MSRKIHYCMMTQNELHDIVPNIEKVLPYVDSVTIVDGGSNDGTIIYFRNWASKESKIRFFVHPWEDDFPKQRNKYLKHVAEIASPGDWILTCFDDKTEVLTRSGWKLFKDVSIDTDEFLTLNPSSQELEWEKAYRKIEEPFEGNLKVYSDKRCDFSVTPNHKMYVSTKYTNWSEASRKNNGLAKFSLVEAGNLEKLDKVRMLRASRWTRPTFSDHLVPGIANDTLASLLGWYLAEGWSYQQDFRKKIQISQVKTAGREEIISLIQSIGSSPIFEPYPHEDTITFYHSKLYDFLQQFGKDCYSKSVPSHVKDLDSVFLRKVLDAYILGDGSGHDKTSKSFTTTSRKLADDIQEICFKLGLSCTLSVREPQAGGYNRKGQQIVGTVPTYVGSISEYSEVVVDTSKIEDVPYTGIVYCVTVPNHTLVVRRNGRAIVCGNCDPDEYFEDRALENLHKLADYAENHGRNMVGFQCRSVSLAGPERVWENVDEYWKHLFIKWDPNFHYTGFKCHEGKGGIPHNILNTDFIYEHVKQENVIWLRGFRNAFHGGGGPNLGERNPIWVKLRKLVKEKLDIDDWHSLYSYLLQGNIDEELKQLFIDHMHEGTAKAGPNAWKNTHWDGSSEMREMYKSYFRILHPEEEPEELKGQHVD